MLLGFDFIQGRSVLDYVNDTFCIDGEDVPMNVAVTNGKPEVCRVTVGKRSVITPNFVKHVQCKLDGDMSQFIVEGYEGLDVLVPKTLHDKGKDATICVMNITDRYRVLKSRERVSNRGSGTCDRKRGGLHCGNCGRKQ
ncbi:hypothetical protein DPMN_128412 [Dreissena polymorpha]|uniref:Uncharacterized protein n=1 Tax=Dreissena polymorpha TaxID=45954 RepID=A0A9D4JWE3_DREPO|nr:hypothetical protein DPMN_128412 [Dreissena polymorpha]